MGLDSDTGSSDRVVKIQFQRSLACAGCRCAHAFRAAFVQFVVAEVPLGYLFPKTCFSIASATGREEELISMIEVPVSQITVNGPRALPRRGKRRTQRSPEDICRQSPFSRTSIA